MQKQEFSGGLGTTVGEPLTFRRFIRNSLGSGEIIERFERRQIAAELWEKGSGD